VRIAIVDTLYPAFVGEHYARRPGLVRQPYAEQHTSLQERSFGTSDAYSVGLNALGHEAVDLLANVPILQRTWAREHGLRVASSLWQAVPERIRGRIGGGELGRIARAQIDDVDAQVVYCQNLSFFSPADLRALRGQGRLVVGQIASEPPGDAWLREYDLLLTSFPHYVERFRGIGVDSEYLRLAFDDRVLDRLRGMGLDPDPASQTRNGAVFMGGVDPRVHGEGVARLGRVLAEVPIDVYGYGGDQLPEISALRRAWRGEAWGLDMYAVLARAGIALNRHIAAAEGFANNMRLFEATGVGAMVLTEAAPNLSDMFEPGSEVLVYRSDDELIEVLRAALADPDRRRTVAAAGQRRTLTEHTYSQRLAELSAILEART
jgi:hypothetical protein